MPNEEEKDIIELVIARLQTLPEGREISVGSERDFTKEELIQHVQSQDEIGKKMVEIEMSFLRSLKEGIFYDANDTLDDET